MTVRISKKQVDRIVHLAQREGVTFLKMFNACLKSGIALLEEDEGRA